MPFYNGYEYAGNNPLDRSDPSGLASAEEDDALTVRLSLGNGWEFNTSKSNRERVKSSASGMLFGVVKAAGGFLTDGLTAEDWTYYAGGDPNSRAFKQHAVVGQLAFVVATVFVGFVYAPAIIASSAGTIATIASTSWAATNAGYFAAKGDWIAAGTYAIGAGGSGLAMRSTLRSSKGAVEGLSAGSIARGARPDHALGLSTKQQAILNEVPFVGSRVVVPKRYLRAQDVVALSRKTGNEFAVLTRGNERMLIRGGKTFVPMRPSQAAALKAQGWRLSYHTHPVIEYNGRRLLPFPSLGDRFFVSLFGQERSGVRDFAGQWQVFGP